MTCELINRNSGRALDVGDSSGADGAGVIQRPTAGGPNQGRRLIAL